MSRAFVSVFILPLVRGGTLQVGRPLSLREVVRLRLAHEERPTTNERVAAMDLSSSRGRALASLVPRIPALPLDEATWRLSAAVHDLLGLAHPRIASGPGAESRIQRVAFAAAELAALGAPKTLAETLARHSVVGRLTEVVRLDHTVKYWLGTKTFIGRRPPPRVLAMPRVRAVRVETMRRIWLRDVGVQAAARPAFAALTEASPLGEALDPVRLDPPASWGRMLSVLRFPALGRLVAGRLLETGLDRAGDALAEAFYRFGSLQDTAGPVPASADAFAFVLRYLAHVVWLEHVFDPRAPLGGVTARSGARSLTPVSSSLPSSPSSSSPHSISSAPSAPGALATFDSGRVAAAPVGDSAGRELAVLVAAAARTDPSLVWPPDVPPTTELGRRFAQKLDQWFERHEVARSPRWPVALELSRLAAGGSARPGDGDAV